MSAKIPTLGLRCHGLSLGFLALSIVLVFCSALHLGGPRSGPRTSSSHPRLGKNNPSRESQRANRSAATVCSTPTARCTSEVWRPRKYVAKASANNSPPHASGCRNPYSACAICNMRMACAQGMCAGPCSRFPRLSACLNSRCGSMLALRGSLRGRGSSRLSGCPHWTEPQGPMAVTAMGPKRNADIRKLKVASACSGMSTESFALKRMNVPHRLVLACELEDKMRYFIRHNHKPKTLLSDCTTPEFLRAGAGAELFVAGFPCQTFSAAGRNAGLNDPRGRVIEWLIKWLSIHQPHAFILENVQGLVRRHQKIFRAIMRGLEGILDTGTNKVCYRITWAIMNSRHHGVPQAPLLRMIREALLVGSC